MIIELKKTETKLFKTYKVVLNHVSKDIKKPALNHVKLENKMLYASDGHAMAWAPLDAEDGVYRIVGNSASAIILAKADGINMPDFLSFIPENYTDSFELSFDTNKNGVSDACMALTRECFKASHEIYLFGYKIAYNALSMFPGSVNVKLISNEERVVLGDKDGIGAVIMPLRQK